MKTRLILHADSIRTSDAHTFKAAAFTLEKDYNSIYPKDVVKTVFIKSGHDLVNAINNEARDTIVSLDVVSHGNQGGIHIARKLVNPVKSGFIQRRAHVEIRIRSPQPQYREEAELIEQSMHGLYTDWFAKKGVSYYYNQTYANSTDTRYLASIEFDRFCNEGFVEFHGCRTAEHIPGFNNYFKDNFAKQFSDKIQRGVTVVGHITNSNPNKTPTGKFSDYRHGRVSVYKNGSLIQQNQLRESLHFSNSSTPAPNTL